MGWTEAVWFFAGVGSGVLGVLGLFVFGKWYVAEGRRRFPDQIAELEESARRRRDDASPE